MFESYFFWFWASIGFAAAVVFNSFFEWTFHRFVMHRNVRIFSYPFQRHALVHHTVFKADESYHVLDEKNKKTVPMAWWNGPALLSVTQLPFVAAALLFGNFGLLTGSLVASCLYYAAYEYLHWCMHIPKKRAVERSGIFFRLNGHHLLHHRYMNRNFNVVLPLADWICGTLLLRSPISFAQAKGPSVPDVQPRQPSVTRQAASLERA